MANLFHDTNFEHHDNPVVFGSGGNIYAVAIKVQIFFFITFWDTVRYSIIVLFLLSVIYVSPMATRKNDETAIQEFENDVEADIGRQKGLA